MPGENLVFVTALTEVTTVKKETLGALRWEGNKCYKYVEIKNTTATVAGVAGDIVAFDADTDIENNLVVSDKSDADATVPVAAGSLQGTIVGTLAVSEFGWIQIKGPATLNTALGGSAADGHMLMCGTTDLALEKLILTEAAPNTILGALSGVAADASAKKVVLDCPF